MAVLGTTTVQVIGFQFGRMIVWSWTADSSGSVLIKLSEASPKVPGVSGLFYEAQTKPDDDTPPSANYDVSITDQFGYDVSEGLLANRSDSDSERVKIVDADGNIGNSLVVADLILAVTNAGAGGKGTTIAYIRN